MQQVINYRPLFSLLPAIDLDIILILTVTIQDYCPLIYATFTDATPLIVYLRMLFYYALINTL
jgi:hypothetical protein